MGIRSNQRGGSGSGRGDNPHYTWHPSMGTPHPSEGGAGRGGNGNPPRTAVAGDDEDPMDKWRKIKDNVYDFDEFRSRKKNPDEGDTYGNS